MKKKLIACLFLLGGIILLCLSVILTIIACTQVDVIGGADLPTLLFIFFRQNGGVYSALSLAGVVSLLISAMIFLIKKKK